MLISLLIAVIVLGTIVWVVNQFLPEPFRKIALVVCVVIFVLYLLQFLQSGRFGLI